GNNRVVARSDGTVVQTTHYYPYGMSFAEGTFADKQPYKYNGKELDTENGLNSRTVDDIARPIGESLVSICGRVLCRETFRMDCQRNNACNWKRGRHGCWQDYYRY
uniref:hypothetical protein n=1 Tax=Bacteroides sp. 1001136B_160425_E2 TaxID=2787083 RepID=UPI00189CBDA9